MPSNFLSESSDHFGSNANQDLFWAASMPGDTRMVGRTFEFWDRIPAGGTYAEQDCLTLNSSALSNLLHFDFKGSAAEVDQAITAMVNKGLGLPPNATEADRRKAADEVVNEVLMSGFGRPANATGGEI